ncbi:adhesion G protein-coupled receptor F4 [Embiotoca jacksoni]|uniref:adhesion G protein-coupled receptor F4 n=1 Tax=Embiotoca jacksoni TaxID=100190 RepID=UPI003703E0FB
MDTTTAATTAVTNLTPVATTVMKTTTADTTAVTNSPPVTTVMSTTTIATIDIRMSIRLDLVYTPDLANPSSTAYRELEGKVNPVLRAQYRSVGAASVTGFRAGSVITEFVVQTTEVNISRVTEANRNVTIAMATIAPVIGSVVAQYNSPNSIRLPPLTYTGQTMTLTCGLTDVNLGTISSSEWKLKGQKLTTVRFKIVTAGSLSTLTVTNVKKSDIGTYECLILGTELEFFQKGNVTSDIIKDAPNVLLQDKINVECKEGDIQPLKCCVQSPYKVSWFEGTTLLNSIPVETTCIRHDYTINVCTGSVEKTFICKVDDPSSFAQTTKLTIFTETITCNSPEYGTGREGDRASGKCDEDQEGTKTAECQPSGQWVVVEDTCIIKIINDLLSKSEDLVVEGVPVFVVELKDAVQEEKENISNSSATISAIVDILNTIANISDVVSEDVMLNVLNTVDVIIGDDARESWAFLNSNETLNSSSELLGSMETLADGLNETFTIKTQRILLNRTMFDNSFMADLNSSVVIQIPNSDISNVFITTIVFSTLNNVMPTRNSTFDVGLLNATGNGTLADDAINAAVVLVKINATVPNVTLSYNKLNGALSLNPQCVFWNFTLFNETGAWDDEGCIFVSDINNTVTCSCDHLTSFSILMATDIPPKIITLLDVITYVGVGISLASLVICLIIEGYVWKAVTRNSTAFMRHVSIINTALSLLIADICFIIAAFIAKNPLENPGEDYEVPVGPCSTATFFMHFFYLALFFWMLVSGLLLFYRTVMVFSHMSKSTMLAIGFTLGYVCPLIIAVITVAVTAPGRGYIRKDNACWLNWLETKALLALVIPALTIVLINILIVIVVLFKMLRRGVGDTAHTDEKHTMVVILRCVAILTPLFGLTWSLGVGTMISPTNEGIHIAFAFFNSLQGFFILVFGTLFDSKIRSLLSKRVPTTNSTSNPTRSTSDGIFSLSGMFSRIRGRNVYHVSGARNSNSSSASESYVNI